jgi:hypothetical protein
MPPDKIDTQLAHIAKEFGVHIIRSSRQPGGMWIHRLSKKVTLYGNYFTDTKGLPFTEYLTTNQMQNFLDGYIKALEHQKETK